MPRTEGRSRRTPARLLMGLVALAAAGAAAQEGGGPAQVVASSDFEGPYSSGDQQIQEGCANNWQWGRKDMQLRADMASGRPGTAQRLHTRGIASGGVQFFYLKVALRKGLHYRVSYWMKADGLEGPVRCHIRKVGYPWTEYVVGPNETPDGEWRQHVFTGTSPEDVSTDVGVCWDSGSVGTIWLDDLKVEESAQPFPSTSPGLPPPPAAGNLLPRSSFEGKRDHAWSTLFFGWPRNGIWEGVEADWEDPQWYRAEGGKVGRYCLAVPSATHAGQAAAISIPFTLLSGKPYTVSAWMKADPPGFPGSLGLLYFHSGRHHQAVAAAYPKLTAEWQRVSFTGTPEPPPGSANTTDPVRAVLQIAPGATQKGTVYVDGLQVEPGERATDYRPAHPLELYAAVGAEGGSLLQWGERVTLSLLVAAADSTSLKQAAVEVTVVGYPSVTVWRKTLALAVGEERLVDLDLRRRGLFRVEMRTPDERLAAPQELVFAVVPPPRGTGEAGMFGTHLALRPSLVEYVRRLGFTWTRLHDCSLLSKWGANEPEPGKYQWHDEVVEGVRRGGLRLLALPDDPPKWALFDPPRDGRGFDVAGYGRYCEAAARHYAGKMDDWELWNEPYMSSLFADPAVFGAVMQAGYAGLKRGNPSCRVLGWCADVSQPAWGAQIPEEARRCLDIFSFHDYVNNLSGGGTLPFAGELPEHRKLWPAHVTECWDTEGTNGAVCGNGFYRCLFLATPMVNEWATAFASRVWIEHAKAGVRKFFVYQMHNVDSMMYYGGYQSLLIQYDRTPTPAAVSTSVTAYAMDGLKPVECPAAEGVVQGLFAGGGRATWVVYDDGGVIGRRRLDLAKLPAGAQVLDVMGNDPRRDGRRSWEVGMTPLFVLSDRLPAGKLAAAGQAALSR